MQLLPATFKECCEKLNLPENSDPFNIDVNIHCGCYYLNWIKQQLFPQVDKLTSIHCYVMSIAYNTGINSVGVKYAREIISRV
jgi:soluble lytic murein transglycosylase-like protein